MCLDIITLDKKQYIFLSNLEDLCSIHPSIHTDLCCSELWGMKPIP